MVMSLMLPAESISRRGRPCASVNPSSLLVRPPLEIPMAGYSACNFGSDAILVQVHYGAPSSLA
jgi:hypothetical protein